MRLLSLILASVPAVWAAGVGKHDDSVHAHSIHWGACDPSVVNDPKLICGFFRMPLDYHNTSAGYGRLAVAKVNATGVRRGTVFYNPGGPGLSGIEALDQWNELLLNQTGGEYDIVTWDPRGVGALTVPGQGFCFTSPDEETSFFNGTIETHGIEMTGNFTDPADLAALRAQAPVMQEKYLELGKRCLDMYGEALKYLGTTAAVRDIVAMADVLDGRGSLVNFIGLSYGTIMGNWLINMFPERVGRIVLDGVGDPEIVARDDVSIAWDQKQTVDADSVFKAFFTGCTLAGPENCGLTKAGDTPLDVNDRIQTLLKTGRNVWFANSSAEITSGIIRLILRGEMYIPTDWAGLSNATLPQLAAVVEAEAQDAGVAPGIHRKREGGSNDTTSYTIPAIACGDSQIFNTSMAEVFEGIIDTSRNISHMFGASWPFPVYYCPFWPVRAVETYTGPFNKTLAHRVLVIGNTFDPATPFFGAKAVADDLGDQAALVRMNGFGHTSQAGRSSCIDEIMSSYMTHGRLPDADETVCEMNDDFELWPGVNTKMILDNIPASDA